MTLSVLIPTYNYNARALVEALEQLAATEHVEAEILVGDDASTSQTDWLEEVEARHGNVHVLRSPRNLGRAHNLNRLAERAVGEWFLVVDCDAKVEADFSLQAYLRAGREAPVVCGGLRHPDVNPCPEATLRYAYERVADRHRDVAERSKHPYAQFSTFNLLVRRDVFLAIRFDEACTQYGYEDTLFGAELERRGVPLLHIDNALVHMGLEPNEVFLAKTETALRSLVALGERMEGYSRLERVACRLRRWRMDSLVAGAYKWFSQAMRRNLLGSHPSLTVFSLYKLGYFLTLRTDGVRR